MSNDITILNAGRQLHCPECNNAITCCDPDHSIYFGCHDCNTFFKRDNGVIHVERKFAIASTYRRKPDIPIGSTGELNGRQYTVVGMMRKRADNEAAWWMEYCLTSPGIENYHILAEYNGHWTLIWKIADPENYDIEGYGKDAYDVVYKLTNRKYYKYAKYHFNIEYAVGEFDWDILAECNSQEVTEYIDPPDIVVSEYQGDDSKWYQGTYIKPKDIAKAFGVEQSALPAKTGMGALEVPTFYSQRKPLLHFTILILIIISVAELTLSSLRPAKNVFSQDLTITTDTLGKVLPVRSSSFELNGSAPLDFTLQSNVHNGWVELDVSLVNEATGQSWEFSKAIEYYAGVEDGESWSEGGQEQTAHLNPVPKGTYHLNIQPYADAGTNPYFSVRIDQDGYPTSNIIMFLLVLFAYPALQYLRRYYHENERWQ